MKNRISILALSALAATASVAASAQEIALNGADTAWVLVATALVLFMTLPGLALFYGGLVRSKNVLSVLMQCFAITCLVSLLWFIAGYGLAFGDGGGLNSIIGASKFLLAGIGVDTVAVVSGVEYTIPESVFFMFQMTFAIITPALVIGAFAERMRFSAVLWFAGLWLLLVYAPICHWVWGGGWLGKMGLLDFAGGTVVHINAGVAAMVAAVMLGPRKGFPGSAIMPHNLTLVVSGASMLWVGWFGFNGGSALAAGGSAGMAMLVTHLSAAAGALSWIGCEWIKHGKPSVLGIVTGMVAGLGTITPASGFVGPAAAVVIGGLAGIVCYFATQYVKRGLRIDDSLDVFPVHGVGGILGTLLTAVFASSALGGRGLQTSMADQFLTQLIGVAATIAWCAVVTVLILSVVEKIVGLRVSAEVETEGLDLTQHDERGYSL